MIIKIDGQKYYIADGMFCEYLQSKMLSGLDKEIKLPNGPKIDLRKNSLLSVGIRQVFTFLVPVISWMAEQIQIQLPKKEKHANVIEYLIKAYFMIMQKVCERSLITIESEPYTDEIRTFRNASLSKQSDEKSDIPVAFMKLFD
jgi:hypothetical protein